MQKAIYAVDELCGLIVATALTKPQQTLAEVDTESLMKKMKQRRFAVAINRDHITRGATELGLPVPKLIEHTLSALQDIHKRLGL